MRLYPHNLLADAKEERRQGERAFTMVEIAIAIGVIGFALVAVIGILPAGMNVQKDNREETTISQDAPFFIDAIRNGTTNLVYYNNIPPNTSLDFLTNYVEQITIISNYGVPGGKITTTTPATFTGFSSGWQILGLLSTPEMPFAYSNNFTITRAIVRSLTGAAVQQNGANQATAFRYQMDVEIVPSVNTNNVAPDTIDYQYYINQGFATNSPQVLSRYYRYLEVTPKPSFQLTPQTVTNLPYAVGSLAYSCFDVKLRFSWPVVSLGNGQYNVGPNHQTYRTTITSGISVATTSTGLILFINGQRLWYFQPQTYYTQGYL